MTITMTVGDWIIALSSTVTGIATVFIALYGWKTHQLTLQLKAAEDQRSKREEEFRQQLSDLYQAITIATLLSGPSGVGAFPSAIEAFQSKYKGKVRIF